MERNIWEKLDFALISTGFSKIAAPAHAHQGRDFGFNNKEP